MKYFFIAIFGLIIGSFLNVCIYRIPRKGSVAKPKRSFCPHCNHTLSAYDNIPVISYMILRGKCRYCKGRISPRYFTVELLTAFFFILMLYRSMRLYQDVPYIILELMTTCTFVGLLIAITFIDLEFFIIPNKLSYTGLIAGLLFAIIVTIIHKDYHFLISRLIGAVVGASIILLIAVAGSAIFKKEAMGMGDVKLMAMIGLYLGWWPHIIITLVGASLFGSIIGVVLIIANRKKMDSRIPFGPFLAFAAVVSMLYGEQLWNWYRTLMGI
jgi:leader peptidase (prepilin peptidase)/N-methyltransferase